MVINIDYLKIHVHLGKSRHDEILTRKKQAYSSRHYSVVENIYLYDIKVAVMESEPHSSILHPKSALIKIENQLLYNYELFRYIDMLIYCLTAEVKNISRLDVCADFIKFKNNLKPASLIRNFMQEKYLRNKRGKYTIIGSQRNVQEVEYLRFGSKSSDVNVYLYNKTKEMNAVKYKKYIAEKWAQLDNEKDDDVWRLEVSLTSQALTYVDTNTSEIFKINLDMLKGAQFVENLFYSLVLEYFEFRKNNGTKNKSRMPEVQLIDRDVIVYERQKFALSKDITKRDKVLLKNMFQFEKRYAGASAVAVESAVNIKKELIRDNYLSDYLLRKKEHWQNEIIE